MNGLSSALRKYILPLSLWVACVVLRLFVLMVTDSDLVGDEKSYWTIAQAYADQGTYACPHDEAFYGLDNYRAPLLPWMIWGGSKMVGFNVISIRVLLAVLSSLLVFPAYWMCRGLGAKRTAGWSIAFLVSCHPFLLLAAPKVLVEGTFAVLTTLIGACVWNWRSRWSAWSSSLCGCAIGLAVLLRPPALFWIPVLAVVWPVFAPRGRRVLGPIAAMVALLVLAPWLISLRAKHGAWIPVSTAGTHSLWNGNNPQNGETYEMSILTPEMRETMEAMSTVERMTYMKGLSFGWIQDNPSEFWRARWHYLGEFWKLWPADLTGQMWDFSESHRLSFRAGRWTTAGKAVWYVLLILLLVCSLAGFLKLLNGRPAESLSIMALMGLVTLAHVVMIAQTRYRYPFDILWMIPALWYVQTRMKNLRMES